ncbi:MAG: threonine synthase [Planctomycetaceae bacterium]|nr:threonine synthase [Planctomycetaceae bacterium]MCP4463696.1 threonine synthase [Planctomycetaceae bacterium]
MPRFVTHLESALDGTHLDANQLQTLHAGRPLWVKYDLPAIAAAVDRDIFATRDSSMFRYRELLPVGDVIQPVSLGEGNSPLLPCPRLGKQMGLENLFIKDESQLPTGSFKSRGLSMAVTMAKHFGVEKLAIPTAGNAGGATAAYAARAGMQAYVLMPADTPIVNMMECVWAGAQVYLVDGLINDCGRLLKQGIEPIGWFDLSTLKEPYRIEGKKTMGLEIAQQFDWKLPDVILYPTGGGTGLIGMWKAFNELRELGWLDSKNMPRMVSVQSDGCCPISTAFDAGERFAEPFENASTAASGLRVPVAVGDFMILDAVRESGGLALAAPESKLETWQYQSTQAEGISVCPETAACIGALEQLVQDDWIKPDEKVVVFNTGAAQKYVSMQVPDLPRLDAQGEIDWRKLID